MKTRLSGGRVTKIEMIFLQQWRVVQMDGEDLKQ
jgi:hypothetical protein